MTAKNIDEFYMVLPSNSSPKSHPSNIAADYIVGWDAPIELDPNENWKVALTEASYIFHPHTISSNLDIEYETMKTHSTWVNCNFHFLQSHPGKLALTPISKQNGPAVSGIVFDDIKFQFHIKTNGRFQVTANMAFSINEEKHLGMNEEAAQVESGVYQLTGSKNLYDVVGAHFQIELTIRIYFHDFTPVVNVFKFPSDQTFTTVAQLLTYLRENCKTVFSEITANTGKKMIFSMGNKVSRVKFNGGLNFILGFYESEFKMVNPNQLKIANDISNPSSYQADIAPQLNRGVKNMYIYASCCAPVYVGHTRVPLLKNIFVDASHDGNIHGHVRNMSVQNPMYVNVAASILNSIEINIRNDAGHIIGFPKGAITVLTLHFKKFPK